MRRRFLCALALGGWLAWLAPAQADVRTQDIVATYIRIAEAMYGDTLLEARKLKIAVDAFLAKPTAESLSAARKAWIEARVPYQQTEGFRFGNKAIDELEGRVNAWPLDEGLIDYVDTRTYGRASDENALFRANIIANPRLQVGRQRIDARKITKSLLADKLHEAQGVEANVAIGYHAIEFLLWGQDTNGDGPGAGNRPYTDFIVGKGCTKGHCDRRRDYLRVVTDLLVDDIEAMADAWEPGGTARKETEAAGEQGGLAAILTGLGSLSYGELAGERMKLGLMLHDPEEEHDCFSDNTHNSHYFNQVGIVALYRGRYTRLDGQVVAGPGIADLASERAPEEAKRINAALAHATERLAAIKARADAGVEAYDQMIGAGNRVGNALVQEAVDGLIAQARAIEDLVGALGLKIKIEGSKSLDDPAAVKK